MTHEQNQSSPLPNNCFGGFSLSALAVRELAKRKGRPCFFFKQSRPIHGDFEPLTVEETEGAFMWSAFDVPNPNEVLPKTDNWHEMTLEERQESNRIWDSHSHDTRPDDRADSDLIAVVEDLGDKANGSHAKLKIVEVPDGIEWEIDEYDGSETVDEKHRSWG